jgi:hypothetical protein
MSAGHSSPSTSAVASPRVNSTGRAAQVARDSRLPTSASRLPASASRLPTSTPRVTTSSTPRPSTSASRIQMSDSRFATSASRRPFDERRQQTRATGQRNEGPPRHSCIKGSQSAGEPCAKRLGYLPVSLVRPRSNSLISDDSGMETDEVETPCEVSC